jgi:hypothetical protein
MRSSITSQLISLRSVLMLSFCQWLHLSLKLSQHINSSHENSRDAHLGLSLHATCPAHLDVLTLTVHHRQHNLAVQEGICDCIREAKVKQQSGLSSPFVV